MHKSLQQQRVNTEHLFYKKRPQACQSRIQHKQERTKYYEKAQLIFKEEAPWVTLAHARVFRAMSNKVVGYKIEPLGTDVFYEVDLEQ